MKKMVMTRAVIALLLIINADDRNDIIANLDKR